MLRRAGFPPIVTARRAALCYAMKTPRLACLVPIEATLRQCRSSAVEIVRFRQGRQAPCTHWPFQCILEYCPSDPSINQAPSILSWYLPCHNKKNNIAPYFCLSGARQTRVVGNPTLLIQQRWRKQSEAEGSAHGGRLACGRDQGPDRDRPDALA